MAIKLENALGTVVAFIRSVGSSAAPAPGEGVLGTHLEDVNGLPLAVAHGQVLSPTPHALPMAGMNDGNALIMRMDRFGGVASATHVPLFAWAPEGTTINTRVLTSAPSGFAPTQTALVGIRANPTAANAANNHALFTSRRRYLLSSKQPVLFRLKARIPTLGVLNANFDAGFGAPATNVAPADGCAWRADGSGVVPVLYIGGSTVHTGEPVVGLVSTDYYYFDVIKEDDAYTCNIQNCATGETLSRQVLQIPGGQARMAAATRLPVYFRSFNSAVPPSTASDAMFAEAYVALLDTATGDTPAQIMPGAYGLGSETNPTTYATSSNLANSAVAPTVTLSNTTPGSTLLDGAVRFAAPAGAVTDYTLFGFTVTAPLRLHTKGAVLACKNLGAAVAGTPTQIDFFLVADGATSLAAGSTKRKYVGTQTFAVGATVAQPAAEGRLITDLSAADLITEAGAVVHLVARISTGTATTTQVIEVMYQHIGHFE